MKKRNVEFRPRIARPVGLEGIEIHTGRAPADARSARIHPDYLLFVATGTPTIRVECNRKAARIPEGSLLMVEPERSLEISASHDYTYRGIFISPEAMRQLFALRGEDPRNTIAFPRLFADDAGAIQTFLTVHGTLEKAITAVDVHIVMLRMFLVMSGRALLKRVSGGAVRRAVIDRVRELIIEAHPGRLTLDQLSRRIGMSKYALVHAFTREFGIPPHTYQTYLRVKRARTLIREGCAISDVALAVGFADQSHLNRHFKRFLGYTPGVYARQVCECVERVH